MENECNAGLMDTISRDIFSCFKALRIEDWGDLNKSGTGRNFDGELRSKSHNLGRF